MKAESFRAEKIATLTTEIHMLKERYYDKVAHPWDRDEIRLWDAHITFKEIELKALEQIKEKLEE